MRDKCKLICLMCIIFILTLSGCGGAENAGVEGGVKKRSTVNWERGFQKGTLSEGSQMYALDYRELSHEHPEDNSHARLNVIRSVGDDYIDFRRYYLDDRSEYYLERIPMGGGETSSFKLHPRDWSLAGNEIWGFDAIGEHYYFGVGIYTDEAARWETLPEQCFIVTTDKDGKLQSQLDITAGLSELETEGGLQALYMDVSGYIYVISMDVEGRQSLGVLDSEGKSVFSYVCKSASKDAIFEPVRDDSGRIFFPVKDSEEGATRLLWKNTMDELTELARFDGVLLGTWYSMLGSELYYVEDDCVVKWDVVSGVCETVYDLKENGISDPASTFLSWDSKNNAYLRYVSKSEDWVSRLSTEEPKQREAISVGIMTWEYGADFMKSSLANFSRKYPQYPITVEKTSSKDNSKERMLIEVMNGKGPDVLYLSYEDLLNLKNQDALMCIDTLISDTTMDSLLPGVSEFGMFDGKLYGIPTCVDIKTMFTNRELWDGEGWTLDDILGLIKANPDISAIFSADDDDEEIYWTLRLMTQFDLAERKSKFIDWENGISCFEEKDFMNILETILYYEEHKNDEDKKRNDVYVSLQRDRIKYNTVLAFHSWRLSGETFFYLMNEFGENCYPIGVPSEDRQGNYMLTEGLLVVNANAGEEKMETIQALMEYLFSMDCQKKIHGVISVLDDMVDTRVVYDEAMDMYFWMDGTDDWIVLPQKEDGTTYVKEYKELLDSAVPYQEYCPIFDIVWEESIAFFEGERDALTVTRLIDNRVQLYLDENK